MEMCRTCLAPNDLTPLFENEDLIKRNEDLYKVTGVKIEANDGMPQSICLPCLELVNGSLKLRQQSALSEATLLENYYGRNVKNDSNTSKKSTKDADSKIKIDHNVETAKENDNEEKKIIKVEIGKVVWESEVKSEKKSFKELLREKDMKFKRLSTTNFASLIRKENKKLQRNHYTVTSSKYKNISAIEESKDLKIELSDESDNNFDNKDILNVDGDKMGEECGVYDHILIRKRQTMPKEKLETYLALAVTPYNKKGPVRCKLCNKELMNLRNFLNHCKTHFAAENTCEMCGKEFVNRNSMRYHQMRLHGVEKRHKCKFCDYKGVDLYQLKNHERRVHTGEKPFVCDVCGVAFHLRAGIAQHMRKHFANKSIQCDRCPAMFRSRNELTGHRNKVHLMHYTYFCYMCPEKYRAIGTVRKHLERRHGVPRDQQQAVPVSKVRKHSEIPEVAPAVEWCPEMHQDYQLNHPIC